MVDFVLRGGRVIDGSGAPGRTADVAIADGRVVAVGRITETSRRTLDVDGLVVAPGFVDLHTHYDAQVTWDRLCTPSCWHGVTSVAVGNCGFSLAPCKQTDREQLLRMLEHVEGMPFESLAAGVRWEWESFPEYLHMLHARPLGINVGAFIGHSALRAFVLGDAAYTRAATTVETDTMQGLVREAMAAGALGLATSRSPAHVGARGRPVPSRQATRDELRALVLAMAESRRGLVEITTETFPISSEELHFLQELARSARRPITFSAILDVPDRPDVWEPIYAQIRAELAAGAAIFPQVSCRPMRFDFDLATGCASLDAMPCWARWRAATSQPERLRLLAEPGFRAAVHAETLGRTSAPASKRWPEVILEEAQQPEHRAFLGHTLAEIAATRGGSVIDALLDISAAEELAARFSMVLVNYDDERVGALLARRESLIALSDAGAHVSVLCDAGYATHLLGHWVRERSLFSWEEAIRRLTSVPAALLGLTDRGLLVPGAIADVTCFDPLRVHARAPEKVTDFPGGATRYIARADGIAHVLVAGTEFLAHGEWTGAYPGRVLSPTG